MNSFTVSMQSGWADDKETAVFGSIKVNANMGTAGALREHVEKTLNALAGIADPEAAIKEAREAITRCEQTLTSIARFTKHEACGIALTGYCGCGLKEMLDARATAVDEARRALALLSPK